MNIRGAQVKACEFFVVWIVMFLLLLDGDFPVFFFIFLNIVLVSTCGA